MSSGEAADDRQRLDPRQMARTEMQDIRHDKQALCFRLTSTAILLPHKPRQDRLIWSPLVLVILVKIDF